MSPDIAAIHRWIRDDLPLSMKMIITPKHIDALITHLEAARQEVTATGDRLADEGEEIGPPTPLGALVFRMEQGGHTQSDLAKLIGSRSHAAEILAGKRSLSKAQIVLLADEWGIPARSLLGPSISSKAPSISPSAASAGNPSTDEPLNPHQPKEGETAEPDDWDLEIRVFHAANGTVSISAYQQLLRELWKAYCEMEQRTIASPSPILDREKVAAFLVEQYDEPFSSDLGARMNYWRDKCITAGQMLHPERWVRKDNSSRNAGETNAATLASPSAGQEE